MFRSIVDWFKRAVIHTAFAELTTELETAGAVVNDPPPLTLDVESKSVIEKPTRKKTAKK